MRSVLTPHNSLHPEATLAERFDRCSAARQWEGNRRQNNEDAARKSTGDCLDSDLYRFSLGAAPSKAIRPFIWKNSRLYILAGNFYPRATFLRIAVICLLST